MPDLNAAFEQFMREQRVRVKWVDNAHVLPSVGGLDCLTLHSALRPTNRPVSLSGSDTVGTTIVGEAALSWVYAWR